jgi:hypothetical protein
MRTAVAAFAAGLSMRGPPLWICHRPGLAAQACGLACERLIRLALAGALEDPCHLGEQVGPPAGELAQPGRRGALLGGGEIAPLRMMARLAEQLGDEDTVSLRALIDHVF